MKSVPLFWSMVLLVPLVVTGCKGGYQKGTAEKHYTIKGKVVAVDPTKPSVRLDHEDIPGLMKAMEMDFAVEDSKLLEGLKPGDQIEGQLKAEPGKYVITRLEKR